MKKVIKQLLGYYLAFFTLLLELIMSVTIILIPVVMYLKIHTYWWDDPINEVMKWW